MKKKILSLSLTLLLASSPLVAATDDTASTRTLAGLGAGSLAGAIAAGPPGLVIGGLIGALAGNHSEVTQQNRQLGEEQQQMQRQLETAQLERQQGRAQFQELSRRAAALSEAHGVARALSRELGLEISFRTASSDLEPMFEQRLQAIAGMLLAFPDLRVSLSAHADRRGGVHANQRLSQQRLQRVSETLVRSGVAPERISGQALGESQPLTVDNDLELYHLDRRVQLKISLPER